MDKEPTAETERELHLTKNRIAAVDIARVLAALLVMYEHFQDFHMGGPLGDWGKHVIAWTIGTCSPIFFLFAGYFACRNITWKKALYNAWWCLAPYLLWSGVASLVIWIATPDIWAARGYPTSLLGVESLVTCYQHNLTPVNGPLWFMRDLVFLFLLSPLIYRWSKWLLPFLLLLSIVPDMFPYFESKPNHVLTLYSVGFFTVGCFLRTLSKETQQKLLRFHSTPFLGVFLGIGLVLGSLGVIRLYAPELCVPRSCCFLPDAFWAPVAEMLDYLWLQGSYWRHWGFIPAVMAIWALYQTARCIEVHCPRLTRLAVKIAPVTFLTFATHWPIYILMNGTAIRSCWWLLLMPFAIFAIMTFFFLAMKRWCRPLIHLVAHYKLRPDD